MDMMNVIIDNFTWFFSGASVAIADGAYKHFCKKNPPSTYKLENSILNTGDGNTTQIVNQNNYHIENGNFGSPDRKPDTFKNDAMLLEYIEDALENLTTASAHLKFAGVKNNTEDYLLIRGALIDDKWSIYLDNESTL